MKKIRTAGLAVLAILALVAAACGSSGSSSTTSGTSQGQATAVSAAQACSGVTSGTITDFGLSTDEPKAASNGVVGAIVQRVMEEVDARYAAADGAEKAPTFAETASGFTLTFANETISNPAGANTGTGTLSGTLAFSSGQVIGPGQSGTITGSGDLTVTVTDWQATAIIGGTTYNEVANGTMTLSFSGDIEVTLGADSSVSSGTIALSAAATGQTLTITGTVTGSAALNMTVTITGPLDGTLTPACTGTVTGTVSAGSATCTLSADCTGCST